jgi:hypothetical protein
LVGDLDGHEDIELPFTNVDSPLAPLKAAESEADTRIPRVWQASGSIVCLPGFSKLDEAAAIVLAQLLRRRGYGASAEQSDAMSVSFFSLDLTRAELVCICYADRPSNAKLLYAVRRLTKKTKSACVIALFLGPAAEEVEKVPGLSAQMTTFESALDAVEQKAAELDCVGSHCGAGGARGFRGGGLAPARGGATANRSSHSHNLCCRNHYQRASSS